MDTKSFLKSKTLWGGALMLVAWILARATGVEVTPDQTEPIAEAVSESFSTGDWGSTISAIVGLIMVVWGRMTASKKIGMT